MPFKARSEVFKELEKIADLASLTREDRMKYDQSIKMYRDNLVVREFEEMQRVQREKEEARLKEMRLDIEKRQAQLFKQQAQVEKQQAQVDELEAHMREEQAKIERERATIRAEREKMEKGKEETRIEVGRRLKALGMDAGTIAAATGLSAEEIEAL